MQKEIKIGHKIIGEGKPLFIIAEVGVTCNYNITIAKKLIEVTANSGADAVKFIMWFPEEIMSDKTVTYSYNTISGPVTENMFEMLNKLRFSLEQWRELKEYADKKKVIMFATVNSPSGIKWAEEIGLSAYKLSSWDFNYHPLWKKISAIGKPMLIDTGPVNTLEVAKVFKIMKSAGNEQSVLLHNYHTDHPAEFNMNSIPYMRNVFDTLVGFSSKDQSNEQDIMSVTLGACVIEKRLTLNRKLPGHHHIISLEPEEFAEYVKLIRSVQSALGAHDLIPSPGDLSERRKYFRHLTANCDIPAGTKLTEEMLEGKRLEIGVSPEYLEFFLGRTTKRDLKYNDTIEWEDV